MSPSKHLTKRCDVQQLDSTCGSFTKDVVDICSLHAPKTDSIDSCRLCLAEAVYPRCLRHKMLSCQLLAIDGAYILASAHHNLTAMIPVANSGTLYNVISCAGARIILATVDSACGLMIVGLSNCDAVQSHVTTPTHT